jgi:NitT/TauT family transport system permease protein
MSTTTIRLAARRLVLLGIVLSLWEALARFGVLNPFYVPPPSKVAAILFALFADGEIWTHIEATLGAALLGLVLGVIVGAILGVCAALLPQVGEFLDPAMTVLNAVPRIILAPLL